MKVIYNKIIPFKGYKCINLFVPFYILYLLEWLYRLIQKGNAYRNISFEKEAYNNENDMNYLDKREHFSWIEYI